MRAHPGMTCLVGALVVAAYYFIVGWWWIGGLDGVFLPFGNRPGPALICWLLLIAWGGLAVRAVLAGRWLATGAGLAVLLLAAAPAAWGAYHFRTDTPATETQ
ncbi:MAG: hypothetical protein ACTHJR_05060 [Sphingomonas sp.]|uniref:hypothetical protein n=1 Tax=Sphingomonas sp. TaxID=28214 RepID=UPI003F7DAB76